MLGYVSFIFLLILPGLFLGFLTRIHDGKKFTEVLASSFGMSLVVVPLALAAASFLDRGITAASVYGLLLASMAGAAFFVWRNRVSLRKPRLNSTETAALSLVVVQGLILWLQFTKYPIFPIIFSSDFGYHLQTSLQLQAGEIALTGLSYPPAVHLLIAAALSLQPGISLSVMQHAVAIIGAFAPLLIFAVASRTFDQKIALVASLIYVFTASFWYTAVFASGLFANFLGNLITIAAIYLIVEALGRMNIAKRTLLLLSGIALYISHYTVVIFVVALWFSLPLILKRARSQSFNYLQAVALITLPGVAVAIVRPDAVTSLLSLRTLTGELAGHYLAADNPISAVLAPISPFLNFLYLEIGSALLVVTFATIALALYWAVKRKEIWTPMFLIWFFIIWITTPSSDIAWRFSKYSLLPLTFLWPLALWSGLSSALSKLVRKKFVRKKGERPRVEAAPMSTLKGAIVLGVAAGLVFTSPISFMFRDLPAATAAINQNQSQVYDSMQWLANNGANNAKAIGVGDWRFQYLKPIWGRDVTVRFNFPAKDAYDLAVSEGYRYILVSNFLVLQPWSSVVGDNPQLFTFENFEAFKLEYSNPSVKVYSVKP